MGRLLKRVPLDFNWPINKTWEGYLNPHYKKCPDCERGVTKARTRLQDIIRLLMLSGSDSVSRDQRNHPWIEVLKTATYGSWDFPGKDMAELTTGLSGRSPERNGFGHDGSDNWKAEKKIIEAAGLDDNKWGICPTCKGDAIHPDYKEKYENWEQTEPPTGEGFQMWENTSEGSPQSPVFATLDELCEWLANTGASIFADFTETAEGWKQILDDGFVKKGNIIFF